MIKLNYDHKSSTMDIKELEFKNISELRIWLTDKFPEFINGEFVKSKTVYLFTYTDLSGQDGESEIIITEKLYFIDDFLSKATFFGLDLIETFFLFECVNYEDAYKTAIDMKEPNPLCYAIDHNLN